MSKIIIALFLIFTGALSKAQVTWTSVSAGGSHSVGLRSDGSVWGWGYNTNGQLGDGTFTDQLNPVRIGSFNDWIFITAGRHHNLGIRADHSLWAWGFNALGQLGVGNTVDRTSPVRVGSDNNWVTAAGGVFYSLGLKSDGTLWAWGENSNGQLGDGSTFQSNVPIQVGTDNNWVNIAATNDHSLAIKADGSLWAWGNNDNGQLGDETNINRLSPVRIGTDNDWATLAGGCYTHSLALKTNGSLWAWGNNDHGQLGDGTTISQNKPEHIGSLTWLKITGGKDHSHGIASDGTLWSWGNNAQGESGDATTIDHSVPVQVGVENQWLNVSGGGEHTLAYKIDRSSFCATGSNGYGELGTGTTSINTFVCVFLPPVINSFSPTSATATNTVTITGTNFLGVTAVSFGGTAASSFTIVNATTITAVVGSGQTGNVTLSTANSSASRSGFVYLTPAVFTSSGICKGSILTVSHPESLNKISWYLDNVLFHTSSTPATGNTSTTASAGNYWVVVRYLNGTSITSPTIQIISPPGIPGTITSTPNITNICRFTGTGDTVFYSISPVAEAVSYSWKVPMGGRIVRHGTTDLTIPVVSPDSLISPETIIGVLYTNIIAPALPYTTTAVRVSAYNACSNSTNRVLAITSSIPSQPTIAGPLNVCSQIGLTPPNDIIIYSIASPLPVGALRYRWSVSNPATMQILTASTDSSLIAVRFTLGSFVSGTISASAVSGCGVSANRTITVKTSLPPTPSAITGLATVCPKVGTGETILYTATAGVITATTVATTRFSWQVPLYATIVSGNADSSIIGVQYTAGFLNGVISVRGVSDCGTKSGAVRTLSITTAAPARPTGVSGLLSVCAKVGTGEEVVYTASGATTRFAWNVSSVYMTITNASGPDSSWIAVKYAQGFVSGTVSAKAVSNCGLISLTATQASITIAAPPTPDYIDGLINVCERVGLEPTDPVRYSVSTPTATGYSWSVIGLYTSITNASGPDSTWIDVRYSPGFLSGSVRVSAKSNCGLLSTALGKSISTLPLPPAPTGLTGLTSVCDRVGTSPTDPVRYDVTGGSGKYSWYINGAFTSITDASGPDSTWIAVRYSPGFVSGDVSVYSLSRCGRKSGSARALHITTTGGIPTPTGLFGFGVNGYPICPKIGTALTDTVHYTATGTSPNFSWTVTGPYASITDASGPDSTWIAVRYLPGFISGSITVNGKGRCGAKGSTGLTKLIRTEGKAEKILILHWDVVSVSMLRTQLLAQPGVTIVDVFGVPSDGMPPTLAQIQQYDVVFVNGIYISSANSILLGNTLADYFDANGFVIAGLECFDDRGYGTPPFQYTLINGRWLSGNYSPFKTVNSYIHNAASLGSFVADHPIMQGISTLNSLNHAPIQISAGATLVASWNDNRPLIAFKGRAVGISTNLDDNPGTWPGDFASVIVNAGKLLGVPIGCSGSAKIANAEKSPNPIYKNETAEAKLFPNPNHGEFMVSLQTKEKVNFARLQLVDMQGTVIKETKVAVDKNGSVMAPVLYNGVKAGIYQLRYFIGENRGVLRLVIQ